VITVTDPSGFLTVFVSTFVPSSPPEPPPDDVAPFDPDRGPHAQHEATTANTIGANARRRSIAKNGSAYHRGVIRWALLVPFVATYAGVAARRSSSRSYR
jgi:hypothetical protein